MATNEIVRKERRDPDLTKQEILDAAMEEFAEHGLRGAHIERIALRTNTSKRMVYYYFGDKEALYSQTLLLAYRRIRQREVDLGLQDLDPVSALKILIRETLQHFENHVLSARVIAYENLQNRGAVAASIEELRDINATALMVLEQILARGRARGVFRDDDDAPDAVDIHQVLSSMALFRVEHQATFALFFGRDMLGEDSAHIRRVVEHSVLNLVLKHPVGGGEPLGEDSTLA